jgi:hypothetical protein
MPNSPNAFTARLNARIIEEGVIGRDVRRAAYSRRTPPGSSSISSMSIVRAPLRVAQTSGTLVHYDALRLARHLPSRSCPGSRAVGNQSGHERVMLERAARGFGKRGQFGSRMPSASARRATLANLGFVPLSRSSSDADRPARAELAGSGPQRSTQGAPKSVDLVPPPRAGPWRWSLRVQETSLRLTRDHGLSNRSLAVIADQTGEGVSVIGGAEQQRREHLLAGGLGALGISELNQDIQTPAQRSR